MRVAIAVYTRGRFRDAVSGQRFTGFPYGFLPPRCPRIQQPKFRAAFLLSHRILGLRAMTIPAKYENGVFRPLQEVRIKEGTLVEVNVPIEQSARRPPPIGDTPFAGLWKDREDMADSIEYINRLRRELRG